MTKILAFGPGPRSKGHAAPECRDHSALVLDHGRTEVTHLALFSGAINPLRVVRTPRVEFDNWYKADPKTPPGSLAAIYHQHARRLGATPEALDVLRQFVTISDQEYKTMSDIAKIATTAKPTFGAPVNNPAEKPAKAAKATPAEKPAKAAKVAPAEKPAKAAKVAPAEKPAKAASGKISVFSDKKIKLLTKDNPKRTGSSAYTRFELYRTAKTVEEFISAGGSLADVKYDSDHGYIQLS